MYEEKSEQNHRGSVLAILPRNTLNPTNKAFVVRCHQPSFSFQIVVCQLNYGSARHRWRCLRPQLQICGIFISVVIIFSTAWGFIRISNAFLFTSKLFFHAQTLLAESGDWFAQYPDPDLARVLIITLIIKTVFILTVLRFKFQ